MKNQQYRKLCTYNRYRILKEVKKILVKNYNATILQTRFDKPLNIKCYTMETNEEKRAKIEGLKSINVTSEHLYLKFIINNYYYSFSFDDNPFFPIDYEKIKINDNGEYIGRRCIETTDDNYYNTLKIHLCYDSIFKIISDYQVKKMALDFVEQIKNYIENGHENEVWNERKRVQNYYNNGYHYETKFDQTKCCIYSDNTNGGNGQYIIKPVSNQ